MVSGQSVPVTLEEELFLIFRWKGYPCVLVCAHCLLSCSWAQRAEPGPSSDGHR